MASRLAPNVVGLAVAHTIFVEEHLISPTGYTQRFVITQAGNISSQTQTFFCPSATASETPSET